jgi:hypothetical protein
VLASTAVRHRVVDYGANRSSAFTASRLNSVIWQLLRERAALAIKLRLVGNERSFQAFDAKSSEARFRRGIAVPIAALTVVLALKLSPWMLLLLPVPVVLMVLSQVEQQEATSELFEAVIHGQIKSSSIEAMEAEIAQQNASYLSDVVHADDLLPWRPREQSVSGTRSRPDVALHYASTSAANELNANIALVWRGIPSTTQKSGAASEERDGVASPQ